MSAVPGWYPDPTGRFEHRYHNGTGWTADVASNGQRYIDPVMPSRAHPPMPGRPGATTNGLATAGMVCGIVGLAIAWIPFLTFAGLATSIVGVILAGVGLRRSRPTGNRRAFAIAGLVTGGLGVGLSVFGIWLTFALTRAVDDYQSPEPSDVTITSCRLEDDDIVAEGEIRNVGAATQTYSIVVELRRSDGRRRDLERTVVTDLVAGSEARFRVVATVEGAGDPVCGIASVRGPLPFGIDLGG